MTSPRTAVRRETGVMGTDKFITASHPQRGTLWAAVDEAAHHLTGKVADRRFCAFLAPFRSREEAEAALKAACSEPGGAES